MDPNEYKFVIANKSKLKQILKWIDEQKQNGIDTFANNREIIAREGKEGNMWVMIEKSSRLPVGYAVVNPYSISIFEIKSSHRTMKLGTYFAKYLISAFRKEGTNAICVDCVLGSEKFWESLGFVKADGYADVNYKNPKRYYYFKDVDKFDNAVATGILDIKITLSQPQIQELTIKINYLYLNNEYILREDLIMFVDDKYAEVTISSANKILIHGSLKELASDNTGIKYIDNYLVLKSFKIIT